MLRKQRNLPVQYQFRTTEYLHHRACRDDCIQHEVGRHQNDRDLNRLFEPLQKNRPEDRKQDQRHCHLAGKPSRCEGIVNKVRRRIRCRQRHRDYKIRGRESKQCQNENLAAPLRETAVPA